MTVMLDEVRIVDMSSSDQIKEVGENQSVATDCERQWIASSRIGIGDQGIVASRGAKDEKFARRIREIRADNRTPSLPVVRRERS